MTAVPVRVRLRANPQRRATADRKTRDRSDSLTKGLIPLVAIAVVTVLLVIIALHAARRVTTLLVSEVASEHKCGAGRGSPSSHDSETGSQMS